MKNDTVSSSKDETVFTLLTPLSNLLICHNQQCITQLEFIFKHISDRFPQTSFEKNIAEQIQHYLKDPLHNFSIPLAPTGTPFQISVWQALQKIKPGIPKTYGQLAQELKSCAQAIGQACRRNPIPLIIPCHRIIAKTHQGGYAGATDGTLFQIKKWLLAHEHRPQ